VKDIKSMFFFGDSICVGYGFSSHKTWVGMISNYLSKNNIVVQNLSINGDTTRMALLRMPHDVQEREVDVLYVQFGLNDCNCWQTDYGVPRVSVESFEGNLKEIITRARVSGVQTVFLATNHIVTIPDLLERNIIYNQAIRRVASTENNTYLIDNYSNWSLKFANEYLLDGVHLNERGHDMYYQHALLELKGMIE